ncbi:hypothetical protein SAMN05216228_1006116 [Rhizobium tibeticum]|uniref:Uncharacterized protein n=1 Tax=Rhizobium tibeticum TaxID=501024 RepID=A0A1H8IHF2_9HYPH|nr:hypothetical protein RTCCBAU85039_1903 [Rhizobium tibeticum]SEN67317.1 hypothetical protein SAMN05216228_1006116 [Rhizobium tibeticum]
MLRARVLRNRQQDRGADPAGLAAMHLCLFMLVHPTSFASYADNGKRAVRQNVFSKFGGNEGALGKGWRLMSEADKQQRDGAGHAYHPLRDFRLPGSQPHSP